MTTYSPAELLERIAKVRKTLKPSVLRPQHVSVLQPQPNGKDKK